MADGTAAAYIQRHTPNNGPDMRPFPSPSAARRLAAPLLAFLCCLEALHPTALAAQAPARLVARAAEAMGGADALRALASTRVEFYAMAWALGQSETAESPPRAAMTSGSVVTDWRGMRRARTAETRAVTGQVTAIRRVTAGGIGLFETGGRQTPDTPGQVATAMTMMRREPDRLVLAALDNPGAVSAAGPRVFRGETLDGARYALGPDTVTLYFDRTTGLLTVVESLSDDPILGDRSTAVMYTRWQPAGAIRLPRQVDVTVNGMQVEHLVLTAAATDLALDESAFAIPDSIAARAVRGPAPAPVIGVQLAELAPGVWRAEGGSHHSLVVDQGGSLVLVEAPQSRVRTQAVLDTLRSRFPAARVAVAVNTHHHWDHAGGLRTVMAAGIPLVTHARNADFARRIAAATKTIAPDELSRRRREPVLRLFTDSLMIGAGETRVVVYAIPTIHGEGVAAAWVPSAGVLFASDVLNPAATLSPVGSAELVAFARSRGLTPTRYAGGHGAVQAWADVERAAAGGR